MRMRSRSKDDKLTCRSCNLEIVDKAVRTAAGPMHVDCEASLRAFVTQSIEEEIAAGRHTLQIREICGMCDEWVSSIYWVNEQGTRLCPGCADKCGKGPQSWD